MLREIRTKEGRVRFIPLINVLLKLKLVSDSSAYTTILSVVFSELAIEAKK
jgi:hypothetical protein